MAKTEVLDDKAHRDLRVITERGREYGESIHFVPVIAEELSSLVLEYPVCLMKDPETGQFGLFALLGFDSGENLFLEGNTWKASYFPLHIRRQPFVIVRAPSEDGEKERVLLAFDRENKRVQKEKGERIFNEDGSNSEYLGQVNQLMSQLLGGMESTAKFLSSLSDFDLIEPVSVNLMDPSGEKKSYDGLYTLSHEKLQLLDAAELHSLNQMGYLQAAFLLYASMGHLQKLVKWKTEAL